MKGFTLVELLVVFMTVTFLAGGMFFYSRSGERQIILFQNQEKVISALQRAKTLAVSAYGNAADMDNIYGYGVHFHKLQFVNI